MLKLIVGEENGIVQSATVPVRWCMDKNTLETFIKPGDGKNFHILIVVAHRDSDGYYKETSRQIAPLEQLIDYVQFLKPGKNTIFATIVWETKKSPTLWKRYLSKENGEYRTDLISTRTSNSTRTNNQTTIFIPPSFSFEEAVIDVKVPEELFAKEYPKWLQKWVGLWHETKPKDQCHFRRRMILAFTAQPLLVLLWLVLRYFSAFAIAFILLLSGKRKIGFKAIIHPWKRDFEDLWCFTEDSIFSRKWKNKNKRGEEHQIVSLSSLAPIFPIIIFLIICLITVFKKLPTSDFELMIFDFLVVYLVIVAYFGICDLIAYLFIQFINPAIKSFLATIGTKIETPEKELPKPKSISSTISYDTEQFLLCNGNLSINIRDLPPKRRTIYLKYQDLKARVCKPLPQ